MALHRANVTESERAAVMGFDWDNFKSWNIEYGYINTLNSEAINKAIREGAIYSLPERSQQTIRDLRHMIEANLIDEDLIASRFVDETWIHSQIGEIGNITDLIEKGTVIHDNQFVSCSLTDASIYNTRAVKLEISIPKGTNAYVTENRMESEMILFKPSYKLKSVAETPEGQLIIQCEVI